MSAWTRRRTIVMQMRPVSTLLVPTGVNVRKTLKVMESSVNVSCCILKYGFAIFGNILAYLFLTTLNLVGNNFRISDCLFSGGTNFRSLQENLREA